MPANEVQLNARKKRHYVELNENEDKYYRMNWAAHLIGSAGVPVKINSHTWTSEDSGVTVTAGLYSSDESAWSVGRVSGSPGKYRVVNQVVTDSGETHERWVDVTILDNSRRYDDDDYGFRD